MSRHPRTGADVHPTGAAKLGITGGKVQVVDPQRSKTYSCGRDTAMHDTALCTQPCQPKPGRKVCHRICTHDLRSCGKTYRKPQNI